MIYEVTIADKTHLVELVRSGSTWLCKLDGHSFPLDAVAVQSNVLSVLIEGKSYEVKQEITGTDVNIIVGHERFTASVRDPRSLRSRRRSDAGGAGPQKISAPMPGKVVRILAQTGEKVEAGQGVVIIEAMKMQNELKSPKKGAVKRIHAAEGALVEAGQVLAEIE
jgi:biotin carboxyl carrier protein